MSPVATAHPDRGATAKEEARILAALTNSKETILEKTVHKERGVGQH